MGDVTAAETEGHPRPSLPPGEPLSSLRLPPAPGQERTQAWSRVLDAGVALIEEGGYEAFTIAAVCERAQVAPRALYDRTTSKDALFLAVYEYGMSRIRADDEVFTRDELWAGLDAPGLIEAAVTEIAAAFARDAAFLRPSAALRAHEEVDRRGRANSRHVSDLFTAVVLRARQLDSPPRTPSRPCACASARCSPPVS